MTFSKPLIAAACLLLSVFTSANPSEDNKEPSGLQTLVESAFGSAPSRHLEIWGRDVPMSAQDLEGAVSVGLLVDCSSSDRRQLISDAPLNVTMSLPIPGAGHLNLKMTAARRVIDPEFVASVEDRQDPWKHGVHYKGIVDNGLPSMAAISFFPDRVIGVVSSEGQTWTIVTRRSNQVLDSEHVVIYRDADIVLPNDAHCATDDALYPAEEDIASDVELRSSAVCKNVRVRFDCDYRMYQDNGLSVSSTEAEVMGWFNVSQAVYLVDGMYIEISEINVFTSPDPYTGTTDAGTILGWYRTDMNAMSWDGDIAHLVSTRPIGAGGVGYLTSNLCSTSFNYCYSNIYTSYSSFPFYSWTVDVVCHEMGHVMGSNHTHWCGWPSGALDNCYTTEGSCSSGPGVGSGGTIMSYCHLTSAGKDFSKGFHPEPETEIKTRLNFASCLDLCPGVTFCPPPTGLAATSTSTTVSISWNPVTEASSYIVRGRKFGTVTFRNKVVSGSSQNIGGLTPATLYEWQMQSQCDDGGLSDWTAPNLVTTMVAKSAGPQMDIYPNPASTAITVLPQTEFAGEVRAVITDLHGRALWSSVWTGFDSPRTIELPDSFTDGLYLLSLAGMEGSSTSLFQVR